MGKRIGRHRPLPEPRVISPVQEARRKMLIGRSDDPQNPCRVEAFEAVHAFGSGSRNPSGPAAVRPAANRSDTRAQSHQIRNSFSKTPCIYRAVHTHPTLATLAVMVRGILGELRILFFDSPVRNLDCSLLDVGGPAQSRAQNSVGRLCVMFIVVTGYIWFRQYR